MDLPSKETLTLTQLRQIYQRTFRLYESHPGRFIGFKTSCGTDQFPDDYFSPSRLFIYPRMIIFSSDVNLGKPVMVTGVYVSEDFVEFLSSHEIFAKILES